MRPRMAISLLCSLGILTGARGARDFVEGIDGVVSECDVNRTPVVTRLSMAYPFIARHVPGLAIRPTLRERP